MDPESLARIEAAQREAEDDIVHEIRAGIEAARLEVGDVFDRD